MKPKVETQRTTTTRTQESAKRSHEGNSEDHQQKRPLQDSTNLSRPSHGTTSSFGRRSEHTPAAQGLECLTANRERESSTTNVRASPTAAANPSTAAAPRTSASQRFTTADRSSTAQDREAIVTAHSTAAQRVSRRRAQAGQENHARHRRRNTTSIEQGSTARGATAFARQSVRQPQRPQLPASREQQAVAPLVREISQASATSQDEQQQRGQLQALAPPPASTAHAIQSIGQPAAPGIPVPAPPAQPLPRQPANGRAYAPWLNRVDHRVGHLLQVHSGQQDIVNIDAPHLGDPRHVAEYAEDIVTHLFYQEERFRPHPLYMGRQRDINHNMRAILVDWLVEVIEEYHMKPQTLYLSIGYIDRFLSNMAVQRGKLQLVGVTCMLLAAKYEEIYPPNVDEFVYITDNTYRREQVLKMEHVVLKVLRFDMGASTALAFLERFIHAASATPASHCLALYLSELSLLLGEKFLRYKPSVTAAAAICLSQHAFARPVWTRTFEHYCRLQPEQVQDCLNDMYDAMRAAPHLEYQAIREKYAEPRFHRVAAIPAPNTCPNLAAIRQALA